MDEEMLVGRPSATGSDSQSSLAELDVPEMDDPKLLRAISMKRSIDSTKSSRHTTRRRLTPNVEFSSDGCVSIMDEMRKSRDPKRFSRTRNIFFVIQSSSSANQPSDGLGPSHVPTVAGRPNAKTITAEGLCCLQSKVPKGLECLLNMRMVIRPSSQVSHPVRRAREQRPIEALRRHSAPPGTDDHHRTRQ